MRLIWVFVVGGSLCLVVMAIWIVDVALLRRAPERSLDPKLITFWNVMFLGAIIWITTRRRRLARVKRVWLRHRRCPHCADLKGLSASPDGATVCPECGCAWTLP